jgi:hypothetical protein
VRERERGEPVFAAVFPEAWLEELEEGLLPRLACAAAAGGVLVTSSVPVCVCVSTVECRRRRRRQAGRLAEESVYLPGLREGS